MGNFVQDSFQPSNISLAGSLICGCSILWLIYTCLYRLYWSPVSGIPGPKLAALTFWYEFYYDCVKEGQYTWKIQSLHKKYGPIVRINPYEVHIDDPDYYDHVYVGAATRKTNKWDWSIRMFGNTSSVVTTASHDLHRRRRAMISNNFSQAAVRRLEPLLKEKVAKLHARFEQAKRTKEVVSLTCAYAALTADIITDYSFAKSYDFLESPDFAAWFHDMIMSINHITHLTKHMPWILPLIDLIPKWVSKHLLPLQLALIEQQEKFMQQVNEVRRTKAKVSSETSGGSNRHITAVGRSIFQAMIESKVPESENSDSRLVFEAQTLVIAGMLTTAHALEVITYHLLTKPDLHARLVNELSSAKASALEADPSAKVKNASDLPLQTLEALPYLNAVIREGLRTSYGVPHRLQRVSPDTTLQYESYQLPPGTPVSMSALMMHENSEIFPDPKAFKPDRWLPLDTKGQQLSKYLVPFSKGSRQCVGMNLAWAELYLTIAGIFGDGQQMTIHDTDFRRDIETTRDLFNPMPSLESKGLRAFIVA